MLQLTRLLSDGAVLRRDHPVHIWGWDEPGRTVRATLRQEGAAVTAADASARVGADGRFSLALEGQPAGGPWELEVRDDAGEVLHVRNLLFGTVWFVSGQSNIDVDMQRCRDSYPEIVRDCEDPWLRTYHIDVVADYKGPVEDVQSGAWKTASRNNILAFSATGYFYARALRELEPEVPVGFIQASLGGSRITCWMAREMLADDPQYAPLLAEADRYADDAFMASVLHDNATKPEGWKTSLREHDPGCREGWERSDFAEGTEGIELPCLFEETPLAGFMGSMWLTRTCEVPAEMAGKSAHLWLGTMVDSDETYVNGIKVGETGYQYPPRKYEVPEGVLRAGTNRITIRLVVESGHGRVTPGKGYFLFNDQGVVDLGGCWQFRIGARADAPVPPTDQVNWKATGLFNAMAAPCTQYPVDGIVWYQGEANTHEPYSYAELTRRYIEGYRARWQEEVPYLYVQLPNYIAAWEGEGDWPWLREEQRRVLEIPGTAMVVTMDLGEDNDLHPHGKKEIGRRLALAADHMVFDRDIEYTGPVPQQATLVSCDENGCTVRLTMSHAAGLYADSCDKGAVLRDLELVDADGTVWPCDAVIDGETLTVTVAGLHTAPTSLRYAYHDIMHGALVYNGAGLPMTPFEMAIR